MGGNTSQQGAISELIATTWLMERGYHVFRSLTYNNPIDLVAWKDGETILIDVTTAGQLKRNGPNSKFYGKKQTEEQKIQNIQVLYVNPKTKDCAWSLDQFDVLTEGQDDNE